MTKKKKIYFFIGLIFLGILFPVSCSKNPASQKHRLSYDKDGMLVIGGIRTFIIGSYSLPNVRYPFTELERQGYNYIRVSPDKTLLDSAGAHHLMTWISLGSVREKTATTDSERISGLVRSFKNHPSLLCWEMEDEPAFTWNSVLPRIKPSPLIKTCRLIKTIDPEHFIITNHAPVNLISTLRQYNPSTDIISCDIYPVIPHGIQPTYALFSDGLQGDLLNPYLSQVGEYAEKMLKVAEHKKPVFMVLQAFAWEMLKKEQDRDPSMILYPTYGQSRFMAYDAIVHGATGIIYWGSHHTPQPSPFMTNLNKVTRELSKMQDILASRSLNIKIGKTYHEMGHSVDAGIQMILKKYNGSYYLITVNDDKNPVKVTFNGLDSFQKANVLKENRTIEMKNGSFTDLYKPFDIHIYTFQ